MKKLILCAVLLTACGKGTAELSLSTVGDTMAFDKTTLTAKAGQKVHVTLTSRATSAAMKHNFVLVNPGKESDVATAGGGAGEGANYVPSGNANVLASTALAAPGGMVDVTFTAPPPGDYPYICTFPGHFAVMKGVFTSTP